MKKLFLILIFMTNQILANTENQSSQVAYLAGGCYWGLEELIRQIPGVLHTKVGFSGGHIKNVSYKEVTRGDTGHAESIKIEFNSKEITYKDLLLNFFKMHNPTTINQQGNDKGTQYRSAIFYTNEDQKNLAYQAINLVDKSKEWVNPVITEVVAFSNFYPANEDHQKYILKNPDGYSCHFVRKFDFTK
jgi:peptide-methionine (S)-S-oxide reductase|tara:strand:+ start:29 stop:595 length:567 start_codon:yes stop_codon:yes gene_type:complete